MPNISELFRDFKTLRSQAQTLNGNLYICSFRTFICITDQCDCVYAKSCQGDDKLIK